MILGVSITSQGLEVVKKYNGELNNELSFFQSYILACVVDGEYTPLIDVISRIKGHYPYDMTSESISNSLVVLESRGFLNLIRAISGETIVSVRICGFTFLTSLGTFFASNRGILNIPFDVISSRLSRAKGLRIKTEQGEVEILLG